MTVPETAPVGTPVLASLLPPHEARRAGAEEGTDAEGAAQQGPAVDTADGGGNHAGQVLGLARGAGHCGLL